MAFAIAVAGGLRAPDKLELSFVARSATGSTGEVFFRTAAAPFGADRRLEIALHPDGAWHKYRVALRVRDVSELRIDPGTTPGRIDIRSVTFSSPGGELTLSGPALVARLRQVHQLLPRATSESSVSMMSDGFDPFFSVEVPPWIGSRGEGAIFMSGLKSSLPAAVFAIAVWLLVNLAARAALLLSWLRLPMIAALMGLCWNAGDALSLQMWASWSMSLSVMALLGAVAHLLLPGWDPRDGGVPGGPGPGLVQLLWIGQWACLALALALTPLLGVFASITGWHVPLRWVLAALGLGLTWHCRRRLPAGRALFAPQRASVQLSSLLVLLSYRALSFHGAHAGALGHDTQQHLYWAQHIADFGFLPLTSRHTDIIEAAPRFFHLLAACWGAAGFSTVVGPFVKLMPFTQTALSCGFLAELLLRSRGKQRGNAAGDALAWGAGLFLVCHLTLGQGQDIYRVADLSQTPLSASLSILMSLPLLVVARRCGALGSGGPSLLVSLPAVGAVALGFSPVVALLYAAVTVPFALAMQAGVYRRGIVRSHRRSWGWSLLISGYCLLQSSWLVVALATRQPAIASALRFTGVRLAAGSASATGGLSLASVCPDQKHGCIADLVANAASHGWTAVCNLVNDFTMPGQTVGPWYWWAAAFPLVCLALATTQTFLRFERGRIDGRLYVGAFYGLLLFVFSYAAVDISLQRFSTLGPGWWLAWQHYSNSQLGFAACFSCAVGLASWPLSPVVASGRRWNNVLQAGFFAAGALVVGGFRLKPLESHRYMEDKRIDADELHAIRRIEEFVRDDETVIIPAFHSKPASNEDILTADQPVGMISPHLRERTLFALQLGASIDYGWHELDNFCSSPAYRTNLARKVNARWVLIRDERVAYRDFFESHVLDCGLRLSELATYPPAFRAGDLALFRVTAR